jgi:hypothetical protein
MSSGVARIMPDIGALEKTETRSPATAATMATAEIPLATRGPDRPYSGQWSTGLATGKPELQGEM